MIHRSRQGPPARIQPVISKLPPQLEVPVKLGPMGESPPGVGHLTREISPGGDTRHTHGDQQTVHTQSLPRTNGKYDTHEEAIELRHLICRSRRTRWGPIREKPAEFMASVRRNSNCEHLRVNNPTQHLELQILTRDFSGGLEVGVRSATFAQQTKIVRRKQLHGPLAVATVRPPLHVG